MTGGTYTVGQMPILMEDFHDMVLYRALVVYFSSTVDNPTKAKEYQGLYDMKLVMLNEYAGSKTVNVDLSRKPDMMNPNLFPQSIGR